MPKRRSQQRLIGKIERRLTKDVVDRKDVDVLDTLGRKLIILFDERRHLRLGTSGRERSGNHDDDILALQLAQVELLVGLADLDVDIRDGGTGGDLRGRSERCEGRVRRRGCSFKC